MTNFIYYKFFVFKTRMIYIKILFLFIKFMLHLWCIWICIYIKALQRVKTKCNVLRNIWKKYNHYHSPFRIIFQDSNILHLWIISNYQLSLNFFKANLNFCLLSGIDTSSTVAINLPVQDKMSSQRKMI